MDTISKKERSTLMAKVRSKNNKSTEMRFVQILRKNQLMGWRRHQMIFGKPDFLFKTKGLVIFIDGCFWHGCPNCGRIPKQNKRFWSKKIRTNRKRDLSVSKQLRKNGYNLIRFWECQLKDERKVVNRIKSFLSKPPAPSTRRSHWKLR